MIDDPITLCFASSLIVGTRIEDLRGTDFPLFLAVTAGNHGTTTVSCKGAWEVEDKASFWIDDESEGRWKKAAAIEDSKRRQFTSGRIFPEKQGTPVELNCWIFF